MIGGGAAGCFAAALIPYRKGTEVTVYEKSQRLLQKVRISGGGRCNLTHGFQTVPQGLRQYPRGTSLLRSSLHDFGPAQTIAWFGARGLAVKTESDGRVFPVTDRSDSVIDVLIREMDKQRVRRVMGASVQRLIPEQGRFRLEFAQGQSQWADRVLIACGGLPSESQYAWLRALGHRIVKPVPSIFSLNLRNHPLKDLAGISVPWAEVKIGEAKIRESGPLLITHGGLSGPAALRASAFGARWMEARQYQFPLAIQWLGGMDVEEIHLGLQAWGAQYSQASLARHSPFSIPRRLWLRLLERAGQDGQQVWGQWSRKGLNRMVQTLHHDIYEASGRTAFKEEFVTAGGMDLRDIHRKTLESRHWPGLYFAGEILDVDGVTGGFNFQHAWSSAYRVAQAMHPFPLQ